MTDSDWQKPGPDADLVVADPRFVSPAENDFAFRPDSRALKLSFQPIDTSQVGPIQETPAR